MKIGCANTSGLEKGRVIMLNAVMFVTGFSVIIFSAVYAVMGYRYFYGPLYILPVTALVLIYNHNHHYARARNLYLFGSFIVICFWCYEGRGNGNEYTLIGLAATSTLLYKRKLAVYSINIVCASTFAFYQYLHAVLPFEPDPVINYQIVPWLILLNTIGVVTFQIAYFRDLANHYDHKLSGKYKEQVSLLEQQRITEEELKASNEKLQDLTEHLEWKVKQKTAELQIYIEAISMNTFATVSDLNGCFTDVNDLIINVSGYSKEELIGKHFNTLGSGRHTEAFFTERRKTLMDGKTWRGDVEHKTKSGSLLWFDCVVIPIRDPNGNIDSFLTLGLPITERKLNETIRENTHKLLEDIAFRASHKIRGPMARIKGLSDLVRRDLLSLEEFKTIAEKMIVCSDELSLATSELVSFVYNHQDLIRENLSTSNESATKPPSHN